LAGSRLTFKGHVRQCGGLIRRYEVLRVLEVEGLRGGVVVAEEGISITLSVPKVLYEKLANMGLDVKSLIIRAQTNA